jgi:hypothetical protein
MNLHTLLGLELIAKYQFINIVSIFTTYQIVISFIIEEFIKSYYLDQIGTCDECATLVRNYLSQNDIAGKYIRLETNGNSGVLGLIWDDGTSQQIANNGYHEAIAIYVGDRAIIFDNIYPQGKLLEEWLADLVVCPGNQLRIAQDEQF